LKKIIFLIIFRKAISCSFSQHFKFEIGVGRGYYAMTDLKKKNSNILINLPVIARITDDFPSKFYYVASLAYLITKNISFGILGSYYTTGSRISYKDFSGELSYDNILSSYSSGFKVAFKIVGKSLRLTEENNICYSFTKYKLSEKILTSSTNSRFKSNSIQIEPDFKLSYLYKMGELGILVGYLHDFCGTNNLNGDKKLPLINSLTKEEVNNNWSGLRTGISFGILF
jgi:hypothetical protein